MGEREKKQRHHVLAIPVPAQGHLNPLMRLCKVIASEGFTITFLNIDPIHHRIAQLHQQHDPADVATTTFGDNHHNDDDQLDIRTINLPVDGIDLTNDFKLSMSDFMEALQGLSNGVERLIETLSHGDLPITCLLSDVLMTGPTQKVAEKFNIPRVAFFPSCQGVQLLLYYLNKDEISINHALDVVMKESERLKAETFQGGLAGLPLLQNRDLLHFRHIDDETEYFYRFMMRECDETNKRAHAIVVNSFEGLEDPAFEALQSRVVIPILPVGPLVEHDNAMSLWKEDKACLEWLDMQPPHSVLYISFGSMALLSESQFEEIMSGLLSSQQRFLWVFRSNLVINGSHSDSNTVVSDLLSKSNGRGCVVDWAPQIRVLSHPSLGGFLTHCGWNSTLEAIDHGVPMLCWPYIFDQFFDAKCIVEEWKVGLRFKASGEDGLTKRDEVERVIRALMEGEEGKSLRNNAIKLKESSRRSLSPGGTSHKNIQALIKSLKDQPQRISQ